MAGSLRPEDGLEARDAYGVLALGRDAVLPLEELLRRRGGLAHERQALLARLAVRKREAVDGLRRGAAEGPRSLREFDARRDPQARRQPVVYGLEVSFGERVEDVHVEELVL